MDVEIRITGDEDLLKKLDEVIKRSSHFQRPLRKAAERVREASRANFTSDGFASGGWEPLDPEYAAWKLGHYGVAPELVRTGTLAESIGGRGVPIEVDAHNMKARLPEIKYAKFHQYGTEKMPARPIVITPPGFAEMVANDVGDYVMGHDD